MKTSQVPQSRQWQKRREGNGGSALIVIALIVISGFLRHVVLPKISHPTKMAAPRSTRMAHQLTRSGCDRRRVERIIGGHDISGVIAFSVFTSRCRH